MKKKSFLSTTLVLLLSSFLFITCSKNSDDTDSGSVNNSNKVFMKNSVFTPTELTIMDGTTVTWVNDDSKIHTVTADDGSFHSGDIQPGGTYSRVFAAGVYPYHCVYHADMTGRIKVVTK